MDIHQKRLTFLEPNKEAAGEIVYPEFKPFFSKNGIIDFRPVHHGLFEPEDEELQTSYGTALDDKFGWSRDRWVF